MTVRAIAILTESYVAAIVECPKHPELIGRVYALETNFNEGRVLVGVDGDSLIEIADTLCSATIELNGRSFEGLVTAILDVNTVEVYGIATPFDLVSEFMPPEHYDPRDLTSKEVFETLFSRESQ